MDIIKFAISRIIESGIIIKTLIEASMVAYTLSVSLVTFYTFFIEIVRLKKINNALNRILNLNKIQDYKEKKSFFLGCIYQYCFAAFFLICIASLMLISCYPDLDAFLFNTLSHVFLSSSTAFFLIFLNLFSNQVLKTIEQDNVLGKRIQMLSWILTIILIVCLIFPYFIPESIMPWVNTGIMCSLCLRGSIMRDQLNQHMIKQQKNQRNDASLIKISTLGFAYIALSCLLTTLMPLASLDSWAFIDPLIVQLKYFFMVYCVLGCCLSKTPSEESIENQFEEFILKSQNQEKMPSHSHNKIHQKIELVFFGFDKNSPPSKQHIS